MLTMARQVWETLGSILEDSSRMAPVFVEAGGEADDQQVKTLISL